MMKEKELQPDEPRRVRAFAHFFKRYMSLSSVIAAALPIPVTSFGLIPTFKAQTAVLSTYTPLFCFLLLGFVFYSRHQLARLMFPEYFGDQLAYSEITLGRRIKIRWHYFVALLPALLIMASIWCIFLYQEALNDAILYARDGIIKSGIHGTETLAWVPSSDVLLYADINMIGRAQFLMLYYLGIFITAETAFILMAIKEYLQDLIGLGEMDLIKGPEKIKHRANKANSADAEKPRS